MYFTLFVFKLCKNTESTTTTVNNRYTTIERKDQDKTISNPTKYISLDLCSEPCERARLFEFPSKLRRFQYVVT